MNNTGRHAYMIMVHNEWRIFKLIMNMLDDERNDFYVHVDLKVREIPYDISKLTKKSKVYLVPRKSVTWGGDSQVICQYELFQAAAVGHYDYYHFISGVDMPLMTADKIFQFFDLHKGNNYFNVYESDEEGLERIKYFYLFQNKIGKGLDNSTIFYQKIRGWTLKLQKIFHMNRLKKVNKKFYRGEVWFSITDELMQYIISQKNFVEKVFVKGWCADELCWNTIAMNSPCADSINNDCMRYIDWNLGRPYIFQSRDYERIMKSGKLFARKFSDEVDSEIVDMIYENVVNDSVDERSSNQKK